MFLKARIKRCLCIAVSLVLVLGITAGCTKGEDGTSSVQSEVSSSASSAQTSSTLTQVQTSGGGGAKPKLTQVAADYDGEYPIIRWQNLENKKGFTAQLMILDLNNKTVFQIDGLTGSSYTLKKWLNNGQEYKLYMYYKNEDGSKTGLFAGISESGHSFVYQRKKGSGNYYFDGNVSLAVLNNYLNRAMTYVVTPDDQPWNTGKLNPDFTDECFRGILNVGAKYLNRFICDFSYSVTQEKAHGDIKLWIEKLHSLDPDIVVEAGIFEYINQNVNAIPIPAWVFEAFGLSPETRNFDLEKMYSDFGKDYHGSSKHVPDVTKLETQMYFYYRAVKYIDLGIESLHMGIVTLIGKNDAATGYKSYSKVINMIRDYAKKNARRHYVFINGHGSATVDFVDENGTELCDFHASPLRIRVAKGETDHAVSEDNPQRCDFYPGEKMLYGKNNYVENDAPYTKHLNGRNYSGWPTDNYPYLVEFDNWSQNRKLFNKAEDRFGYDEISWFANQPDWYRREFLNKAVDKIVALKDNGHIALPGRRTAFIYAKDAQLDYWMNDAKNAKDGFSDEATIKAIYARLK